MTDTLPPAIDGPVLVPIQIEAFVLNEAVCGEGKNGDALIAPITQPNYTFLRLRDFMLQSDLQNHVDLHGAAPASMNTRMFDFGGDSPKPLRGRFGVYLHWILPRYYRVAAVSRAAAYETTSQQDKPSAHTSATAGSSPAEENSSTPAANAPELIEPPTRWMVVRKINRDTLRPQSAKEHFSDYAAWIIESDHQWALADIPLASDLQTDVSPFVVGAGDGTQTDLDEQAEVFIGRKTPLENWDESMEQEKPANISLLLSGNQLFADFQMHNSNVFSMLDNFAYTDEHGETIGHLDYADASYYLVGWHRTEKVDPFCSSTPLSHETIMKALAMEVMPSEDLTGARASWLGDNKSCRLMCHGAMYNVVWNVDIKPGKVDNNEAGNEDKPKTLADHFSRRLRDQDLPEISIGTTPMDALISYCTARKDHDPKPIKELEEGILSLYSLLHAHDDGVEGQREAKDTVYNWNFSRASGGILFHLLAEDASKGSVEDITLKKPDSETKRLLGQLNRSQAQLDAARRLLAQRQWDLFSLWWTFASNAANLVESERAQIEKDFAKNRIPTLVREIKLLNEMIVELETDVDDTKKDHLMERVKTGSVPFFYRARDPTVLVGGIRSGWPIDFVDNVLVRLITQVIRPEDYSGSPTTPKKLGDDVSKTFQKNPLLPTMLLLLEEFYVLGSEGTAARPIPKTAPKGRAFPQFHDYKGQDGAQRDDWANTQPFFPLYAEWEMEYTHIPFEHWQLGEQTARLSANPMVRYGVSLQAPGDADLDVRKQIPIWEQVAEKPNKQVLSGRMLITPQPTFSLKAKIEQLFDSTPRPIWAADMEQDQASRDQIKDNLSKLAYLSAPLSGLTDGMLTLCQGSHLKPLNKTVNPDGSNRLDPIDAALFKDAGLDAEVVKLIMGQSALTPFANMVNIANRDYHPFKPVTHGQLRFLKFNIIDKFGQALAAIDPIPRVPQADARPPSLFPCISDFYEPQLITQNGTQYPNTVRMGTPEHCEYIQIPPQINQDCRLNAHFVMRTADDVDLDLSPPDLGGEELAPWRPASEWDNPVWGWVLINYADQGIQFFLPDGTFYREVRFGGRTGSATQPRWIPFARSGDLSEASEALMQLDELITAMGSKTSLERFWYMITTAQDNLPATPTVYAQYLNSVVGRPLALVNMGWSLELAGPPLECQVMNPAVESPERLLVPDKSKKPFYEFQVRLGDQDSQYDGLVGYFDVQQHPQTDVTHKELDMSHMNTFFVPAKSTKPTTATTTTTTAIPKDEEKNIVLRKLNTTTYPRFTAHYVSPVEQDDPDKPLKAKLPRQYENERNSKLQVYGALVDPFTPVHGYSSFLPPRALQLPPWTWQQAMDNMTAFFHAGPLHLTVNNLPGYDDDHRLDQEEWRKVPPLSLALPHLGAGEWNWLQPYLESVAPRPALPSAGGREVDGDGLDLVYNAFAIDKRGNIIKPGFEKGPYSAIEGFLQLREPLRAPPSSTAGAP